jgi:hypothetical protein
MKKLLLVLLLLLFSEILISAVTPGQDILSGVIAHLQDYHASIGDRRIYVHTDREFYQAGDDVFFQGYILDTYAQPSRFGGDSVLLAISADGGRVLSSKTVMIQNSLFSGVFRIPDKTAEGTYRLVAYSQKLTGNGVGKIFVRPLEIRQKSEINLNIHPYGNTLPESKTTQYSVFASENGVPASAVNLNYRATNGRKVIRGTAKTNRNGNAVITLNIPEDIQEGWMLRIDAKTRKENGIAYTPVRHALSWIKPWFSPEGGNLIDGIPARINGIVTDIFGNMVSCEAFIVSKAGIKVRLKKEEEGVFKGLFTPERNQTYSILLEFPGSKTLEMALPPVLKEGINLELKQSDSDQLVFSIYKSKVYDLKKGLILAYMEGKLVFSSTLAMDAEETGYRVPLNRFGPGVAYFAVFDSIGRLLSERPVYLSQKEPNISFSEHRTALNTRTQASVPFYFKGTEAFPIHYSISISGYKNNSPDLFSTVHLLSEIPHPLHSVLYNNSRASFSTEFINQILATGGTLFSWKEVMNLSDFSGVNAHRTLPLKTVWLSIVQPYLIQNFRDPENAFDASLENALNRFNSSGSEKMEDYSQYSDMLEAIKSVQFYTLINDKIVFRGGQNSITAQDGALIVIDGIQRGSDISILKTLAPVEVASIEISTKPQDIQKYTGLNSIGVIEIWTTSNFGRRRFPEETTMLNMPGPFKAGPENLFWRSFNQNARESQPLEFSTGPRQGSFLIRMNGIDTNGNVFSGQKELEIR